MSAGCGIMDEAAECVNTPRPLTTRLDLGERGLAMKATRTCDAPDCESDPRTPGSKWCDRHYSRLRRYGSLDLPAPKMCAADGCEERSKAKGYCGKHAERVRRHGDPAVEVLIWGDPERRFWTKVNKTETCWLWTDSLTYDGYGIFGVGVDRTGAHRWAYRFTVGEIPEGMHLDHLCRVRNCVNPEHLEVVTPAENIRRAFAKRP